MSYNPIMVWLLYSPLHRIISGITMVIQYTGRKSGKQYRLPIGYLRVGDTLLTTSLKRRKWWRNLRGGAQVILRLKGKDVTGYSTTIEDEQGVMEGIMAFINKDRKTARMFGVKPDMSGQVEAETLRQSASGRVIVRTTLK